MPDGQFQEAPDNATKAEVMALYQKQKPVDLQSVPDEQSLGQKGLGAARSALEGSTFGFSDELGLGTAALINSARGGYDALTKGTRWDNPAEEYGYLRDKYNKEQGLFEKQNPKTALAANLVGALATGGAGASKLLASPRAMSAPLRSMSAVGAGGGLLSGAGYAPTMEDVPAYAATGMVGGAVLPPALALVGKAAAPVAKAAKSLFTVPNPSVTASKTIGNYLGQDGIPVNQLQAAMNRMGGHATLADVGGAGVKGAAQAVAQLPGTAKTGIGEMLSSRQSGSFDRLIGSLKKMSGGDTKYFKNMQSVITRRREQAAPLYESAKSMNIDGNEAQALVNSVKQTANEFEPATRYIRKFMKKNSDGKLMPKMGMNELHSLQRELRDDANKAYRVGSGELGATLKEMRSKLLESMDKIGDYGQARKIYAGESSIMDAMKLGRNVLKDDFDEMAHTVGKMSAAEQEGFINGALKTVRDKLMVGKGDKNAATKLSSQLVRERLRTAFPDDETYKKFIGQLDIEDDFARTYQNIYGGSQTQPRQVAERELVAATKGGDIIEGQDTSSYLVNAIEKVTGRKSIPQPVVDELQRILFTPAKQMTKRDWEVLRKNSITNKMAEKIKKLAPSTASNVAIGSTAQTVSK